jgi:CyaY protein
MNEADFHKSVTATLLQIEQKIEHCGVDIEFENAGDILTLEFVNGSKIIINKQGAANQIWVAAKSGGFHYNLDPATHHWRNDQSGAELLAELSRLVSEQAGTHVTLG